MTTAIREVRLAREADLHVGNMDWGNVAVGFSRRTNTGPADIGSYKDTETVLDPLLIRHEIHFDVLPVSYTHLTLPTTPYV